jgi:hypothetical protein
MRPHHLPDLHQQLDQQQQELQQTSRQQQGRCLQQLQEQVLLLLQLAMALPLLSRSCCCWMPSMAAPVQLLVQPPLQMPLLVQHLHLQCLHC